MAMSVLELSCPSPALQWFVLNDTTSGRLHLRLEWLSLLTDQEAMMEVSAWQWPPRTKDSQGEETRFYLLCAGRGGEGRGHFCLMVQLEIGEETPHFYLLCVGGGSLHLLLIS